MMFRMSIMTLSCPRKKRKNNSIKKDAVLRSVFFHQKTSAYSAEVFFQSALTSAHVA